MDDAIAAVYFFLRSHNGLALTAIRDNELAAGLLGIDIWRTKLVVYIGTYGDDPPCPSPGFLGPMAS